VSTLGSGILSCGGDTTTGPPPRNAAQAYWALQLNQHAVQLALTPGFNTVQLTATPLNPAGTPLSGLGPVTYTASDTTVTVSPTGLVTARFVTQGVTQVVVSLQAQNVTLTDVVRIQVTDTAPQHPLATFSIQPAPGDSAKRGISTILQARGVRWRPKATTSVGDTVCDSTVCSLLVYYTSSNTNVATIDEDGLISPFIVGQTIVTATTLAYGVAKRDSVVFTVGNAIFYDAAIILTSMLGILTLSYRAPKVLLLGVGATINFMAPGCSEFFGGNYVNYEGHPVDVTFDKPALVDTATAQDPDQFPGASLPPNGSGNIAPFACDTNPQGRCIVDAANAANTFKSRRFPVAGIYHYHSSLYPSDTYTIVIK
jgi:hypothetical protein